MHSYYLQVIASISSGTLSVKVNAQMYDTGLIDSISSNIQNEVQNIMISSTVTYESFVIY